MTRMHVGAMLDELGVKLDISKNQRIESVFIIGKVMDMDTGEAFLVLGSNDLDWIDEGALLSAANATRRATIHEMLLRAGPCDDPNCTEHNGDG